MKQPSRLGAIALALVVMIAAFAFVLPATAQESSATEIDSCTVITEPGTYVLTADIVDSDEDACIDIQANDVTFDGDGHTIDGVDAGGSGVEIDGTFDENGFSGVTVRDVTVTDWSVGIAYEYAPGGTVTDVTATSNGVGMGFSEGAGVTLTDSVANDNGGGVSFYVSPGSTIENVTANDNIDDGLSVFYTGAYDVRDVTANGNGDAGFHLEGVTSSTFVDVTANDNARGFSLSDIEGDTADNRIENATARDNTDWAYDSRVEFFGDDTNVVERLDIGSATVSFAEDEIGVASADDAPADPEGLANVDSYANVSDRGRNGGSEITLDVRYDESAVEDAGVEEDTLSLYRFVDDEWTEVSGSSVDTDANSVSATFDAAQDPAEDDLFGVFGQADGDTGDGNGADDGDGDAGDSDDDENAGDSDADGDDAADDGDTDGGDDSDAGSADGDESEDDGDVVDVGAQDITIDLGDVTIADFDLSGPGLADEHVDERTYSVGDFEIEFAGLSLTIGDTDYRFCKVSITVEPFDVILEDVTLGDGE